MSVALAAHNSNPYMIQVIKKAWLYTFCLFLLTIGCTSINSSNREDSSNNQTSAPSGITISNANSTNELRARIEQISQTAQGRVGVKATVLETGESVTLNGNQQFPMQSVYKFPIAMAVLAQVDQGKLKLDQKIRVEASDILQLRSCTILNKAGKTGFIYEKYRVSALAICKKSGF
ncbi:MAG TPA: serine hydrolase [Phormidium sp.]